MIIIILLYFETKIVYPLINKPNLKTYQLKTNDSKQSLT